MGFVAWAGSAVKTNNAINTLRTPHQEMLHIFDPILDDDLEVVDGTRDVLEAKRRVHASNSIFQAILEISIQRFQRPRALSFKKGHETDNLAARRVGQAAEDVARHAYAAPCSTPVAAPCPGCREAAAAAGVGAWPSGTAQK